MLRTNIAAQQKHVLEFILFYSGGKTIYKDPPTNAQKVAETNVNAEFFLYLPWPRDCCILPR